MGVICGKRSSFQLDYWLSDSSLVWVYNITYLTSWEVNYNTYFSKVWSWELLSCIGTIWQFMAMAFRTIIFYQVSGHSLALKCVFFSLKVSIKSSSSQKWWDLSWKWHLSPKQSFEKLRSPSSLIWCSVNFIPPEASRW